MVIVDVDAVCLHEYNATSQHGVGIVLVSPAGPFTISRSYGNSINIMTLVDRRYPDDPLDKLCAQHVG